MPKAEWGVKRTCPNCESRFYDLQREPLVCPECGATFNMDDHGKVSSMRERRVPVAVAEDEDALVDDEDLVEDAEGDEADPLLADDDEDKEAAGPTLADEDGEEEEVAFQSGALINDDDELEEDLDDEDQEDDEIEHLDDVPGTGKAE